jgi:hypothetical protein
MPSAGCFARSWSADNAPGTGPELLLQPSTAQTSNGSVGGNDDSHMHANSEGTQSDIAERVSLARVVWADTAAVTYHPFGSVVMLAHSCGHALAILSAPNMTAALRCYDHSDCKKVSADGDKKP